MIWSSDIEINSYKNEYFMQLALQQALLAKKQGEIPVGAVVVDANETVIGMGYNQTITNSDPTAHAEIVALRQAAKYMNNYRLPETTIYVTLEPCLMCLGAITHARVFNLVYGANDPKTGACGGLISLHENQRINHQTKVLGGILQVECSQILIDFFKDKRKKNSSGMCL